MVADIQLDKFYSFFESLCEVGEQLESKPQRKLNKIKINDAAISVVKDLSMALSHAEKYCKKKENEGLFGRFSKDQECRAVFAKIEMVLDKLALDTSAKHIFFLCRIKNPEKYLLLLKKIQQENDLALKTNGIPIGLSQCAPSSRCMSLGAFIKLQKTSW